MQTLVTRKVAAQQNLAYHGFKPHVQHAIGFVQNNVLDQRQCHPSTLDGIHQTARRGNQDVTSFR